MRMIKTVVCVIVFALLITYSQTESTTVIPDPTTTAVIPDLTTTAVIPKTTQIVNNATTNTNKVNIEKTSTAIRCVKKCDDGMDCTKTNLSVIWTLDNKTDITKPLDISFDSASKLYATELPIDTWSTYLNRKIFCSMDDKKEKLESLPYFLGLMLNYTDAKDTVKEINLDSDNSITITESGTETRLDVISNIPLVCSNPKADCNFEVTLTSAVSNFLRVKTDRLGCKLFLNDSNSWASWIIVPTVNVKNTLLDDKVFNVSFNLLAGVGLNPNFKNLKLPNLKVTYKPSKDRLYTSGGSCYNDPHCTTNDRTQLEFQYKDGEFLLYENKEYQYRVHMISEACIPGCSFCNYCIKSLYIQSIDEFVSFEGKRTPQFLYADLSSSDKQQVGLVWNGMFADIPNTASEIQIHRDEYQYYITSHYGTRVTIDKYGNFIKITPSKLEFKKVFGLLGDYDGESTNDFKFDRDGKELNVTNLNETAKLDKFIESYRVADAQKLSNGKYYNVQADKLKLKYCECDSAPACYDSLTPISSSKIVKRETKDVPIKPDLSQIIGFDISGLLNEPALQPSKESTCKILKDNQMLKDCEALGIIKIDQLFDDCEKDFKATNLTIWTDYYIQTRRGWCKSVYEDDSNYYKEDANKKRVQRTELIKQLCKNDCSGNGTCGDDGKCVCKADFAGEDCSVSLKQAPVLVGVLFKNKACDRNNKLQSCNSIALLVKNFVLSDKFRVIQKPENGEESNSSVVPVSDQIVATVLPNEPVIPNKISVKKITLRVTNDNTKTLASNTIDFTIYNSICHELADVNKGDYVMKAGYCDIGNICRKDGEENPTDKKLTCISKQNQFDWSTSFAFKLSKNLQLILISILLSTIIVLI